MKKYKFGFDIWGLVLFFVIMIPNFIWFAVPAPNDILRVKSITEIVDTIASICQFFMIFALCVIINKESRKISVTLMLITVIVCCVFYFAGWILYYNGIVNPMVILALTFPPCMAFLCFAICRKNMIAVIPAAIFTICHLIYGVVNFII